MGSIPAVISPTHLALWTLPAREQLAVSAARERGTRATTPACPISIAMGGASDQACVAISSGYVAGATTVPSVAVLLRSINAMKSA